MKHTTSKLPQQFSAATTASHDPIPTFLSPAQPVVPAEPVIPPTAVPCLSLERVKGGWAVVTRHVTEDDKVVYTTKTEPNVLMIAVEQFKIAAVNLFEV